MERITVFVGLDYHTDSVQVCALEGEGRVLANRRCPNHWAALARALPEGARAVAALEACAGAASLAEELRERASWEVSLAHPGYVRRMKQSPDKTDFSDARMRADLVRVGYLPRVWLAPQEVRALRRLVGYPKRPAAWGPLVRYRGQLVAEARRLKARVGALLREERLFAPPGVRRWRRSWLGWLREEAPLSAEARWVVERHLARLEGLREEVRAAEERLALLTAEDPVVGRLRALPGVGPVTAWWLRAEVGNFGRFRRGKELARFCGLSPRNASRGARQGDAGLIRAGQPELRAVLLQAAHSLIRHAPRWRSLALRMHAGGKPRSLIAAAVANRWVRWLHGRMAA